MAYYRYPNNIEKANYQNNQTPPTNFAPSHYYYSSQNNPMYVPHKSSNISPTTSPPPNEKWNNDKAYRNQDNLTMANYKTPTTYFSPPHYYYSSQNSPSHVQRYGNPKFTRYNNPYSTIYQPYPQPGYYQNRLPLAGQVFQKPPFVKFCKPNVKPSLPKHIVDTKPEMLSESQDKEVQLVKMADLEIRSEEPNDEKINYVKRSLPKHIVCTKPEILSESQDKEVQLVKMADLEIMSEETNDEKINYVKEGPIDVETDISTESIKEELISIKPKKINKLVTYGPTDINQENQKPAKEKDEPIVIEAKEETLKATLKNELVPSQVSIPPSKLEVQETEPIEPNFKTWAGLFSGWSHKSKDEVLKQYDSTALDTNSIENSISVSPKSVSDDSENSSASEENNNKKQALPANNFSVDDNKLYLRRLGGKKYFLYLKNIEVLIN